MPAGFHVAYRGKHNHLNHVRNRPDRLLNSGSMRA